jgi:Leu/Phe-tRNA-protein transferase
MEIFVKEWKMRLNDQKQKTIGGTYQVKLGNAVVSESDFNGGYNSTDITIPAEILVEAENLDAKIKEAIIKNFTG